MSNQLNLLGTIVSFDRIVQGDCIHSVLRSKACRYATKFNTFMTQ